MVRPQKRVQVYTCLLVAAAEKITAVEVAKVQQERQDAGLATDAQVKYILDLLRQRSLRGDGGGFMTGPTTKDGIERLTRAQASTYITSLREEY